MYDQAKQIDILKTSVHSDILEDIRRNLLSVAGDTEDKAALRLLDILHTTALKGLLSSDLEDLVITETDVVPIRTIFTHVKLITPPVPSLRGALSSEGIPHIVAHKVLRYVDFLNFKHHISALVICFLLIYKYRN